MKLEFSERTVSLEFFDNDKRNLVRRTVSSDETGIFWEFACGMGWEPVIFSDHYEAEYQRIKETLECET